MFQWSHFSGLFVNLSVFLSVFKMKCGKIMQITWTLTLYSQLSQNRNNPTSKMLVVPSVVSSRVPCVCFLPNMKQPVNRGLIMLPSRCIAFIVQAWSLNWKKWKTYKQSYYQGFWTKKQEHFNFYMSRQWGVSFPKYLEGFKQQPHAPVTSSQPFL